MWFILNIIKKLYFLGLLKVRDVYFFGKYELLFMFLGGKGEERVILVI